MLERNVDPMERQLRLTVTERMPISASAYALVAGNNVELCAFAHMMEIFLKDEAGFRCICCLFHSSRGRDSAGLAQKRNRQLGCISRPAVWPSQYPCSHIWIILSTELLDLLALIFTASNPWWSFTHARMNRCQSLISLVCFNIFSNGPSQIGHIIDLTIWQQFRPSVRW
jgi:hypothetical protein